MRKPLDFNFWPSVADMLLAAFMMMMILWVGQTLLAVAIIYERQEGKGDDGGVFITQKQYKEYQGLQKENAILLVENKKLKGPLATLLKELEDTKALVKKNAEKIMQLEVENTELRRRLNDKPPIITLAESSRYKFGGGEATLQPEFKNQLRGSIFPQLVDVLAKYPNVDTIEIIGHTDGAKPKVERKSNLDDELKKVLVADVTARQQAEISGFVGLDDQNKTDSDTLLKSLQFGSNADLGLMRAVAVRKEVEKWLHLKNLEHRVKVRCYSAAQTVTVLPETGSIQDYEGPDEARRRIELRFTQLGSPSGK